MKYPPDPYKEVRDAAWKLGNIHSIQALNAFREKLPAHILNDPQIVEILKGQEAFIEKNNKHKAIHFR